MSRSCRVTFALCCGVAVLDRADQMLLPAAYYEVSQAFDGLSPTALGLITLGRGVATSCASLAGAVLANRFANRMAVVAGCAAFWGLALVGVGSSRTVGQLACFRVLNGAGLGLATPAVLSLVADLFSLERRGYAFGILGTTSNLGAACGSLLATSLAAQRAGGGGGGGGGSGGEGRLPEAGWRLACHIVALLSLVLAAACFVLGRDPRCSHASLGDAGDEEEVDEEEEEEEEDYLDANERARRGGGGGGGEGQEGRKQGGARDEYGVGASTAVGIASAPKTMAAVVDVTLAEAQEVLRLRTFWVLLAQGVFSEAPWYALNFLTLWLELSGWSHPQAALIRASWDVGVTAGVTLGGFVSDRAGKWSPDHGRIGVSQLSIGAGVPLWALLLLAMPTPPYHSGGDGDDTPAPVPGDTGTTSPLQLPSSNSSIANDTASTAAVSGGGGGGGGGGGSSGSGSVGRMGAVAMVTGLVTQWAFPSKAAMLSELTASMGHGSFGHSSYLSGGGGGSFGGGGGGSFGSGARPPPSSLGGGGPSLAARLPHRFPAAVPRARSLLASSSSSSSSFSSSFSSSSSSSFSSPFPFSQSATVYALDRFGEGTLAAATAPIVGVLAESLFGFSKIESDSTSDGAKDDDGSLAGDGGSGEEEEEEDEEEARSNAAALGRAMAAMTSVPWVVCVLILGLAHCTYPSERRRAKQRRGEGRDDGGGGGSSSSSAMATSPAAAEPEAASLVGGSGDGSGDSRGFPSYRPAASMAGYGGSRDSRRARRRMEAATPETTALPPDPPLIVVDGDGDGDDGDELELVALSATRNPMRSPTDADATGLGTL